MTGRAAAAWAAGGILFLMVATANGAGYRYGVSDQAFYIPVVTHALNPDSYPRDGSLINAQGRLMIGDEVIALLARSTSLPLDLLFFIGYLISVALIWIGIASIGNRLYVSPWVTVALAAAMTLRHRIPRTSANSFEPYFHPRMLAFGLGLLAVSALLRRRIWLAVLLVGLGALTHVTTALWFAILIGVAMLVVEPSLRRLAVVALALGTLGAGWALTNGPLQSSMTRMDEVWLQAVASKDSLFPSQWPVWAWLMNLALLPVLWWASLRRRRAGQARPEDKALAWGATALLVVFLVTLPLVIARVAFPVQLQISRVFWLIDALATIYLLALITSRNTARAVAIALTLVAVGRGTYVMLVERSERALFARHLVESPWHDAMRWVSRQAITSHVLADPGHAWKYGTSVRVSGERDVFLEDQKDTAIAIYSRDVAVRVVERAAAIGDFTQLTAERARALADQYDLNFLVTEARLDLPLAYENTQFRIYALSP